MIKKSTRAKQHSLPALLNIITVFALLGGSLSILNSFPFMRLWVFFSQGGITVNKVTIQRVYGSSPASEVGLQLRDAILSVDDETIESPEEFVQLTEQRAGKEIMLTIERNGIQKKVALTPLIDPLPNQGRVGLGLQDIGVEKRPPLKIITEVVYQAYTGTEEKPDSIFSRVLYQDKQLRRLRLLVGGVVALCIGSGIHFWNKYNQLSTHKL